MTAPTDRRGRLSRFRPAAHWPSVAGRAGADAGPLALVAVVVAAVALLAGAVPPLVRATADAAVRDALRRAGDQATVRAQVEWEFDDGPTGGRARQPELADAVDTARRSTVGSLDTGIRALMDPPIASAISDSLKIVDAPAPRTVQLAYLANDPDVGGPDVTWIAGAAPAPSGEPYAEIRWNGEWTVQAGLSEPAAAALGVRPGDHIVTEDSGNATKGIVVSGVFRPTDPADPAWRLAPALLAPIEGADGIGVTRFGGLLSRESLPDARLALKSDALRQTIWLTPDADAITWDSADALAAAMVTLKAQSGTSGQRGQTIRWETQLDAVLRDARGAVDAAGTQASVLLVAVLTAAVLVLLLAADLLARRRATALGTARRRGASLPDLALELSAESTLVALLAGAAGLALARLVTPGVAVPWALPVVLAAVLAGPGFGTLAAARATRNRRAPANRSARRWAARTAQIRRATLEAAIVLAAVGAFVSLRQRGIVAGDDGLPASAPALAAVAAGLLLLRLLPAGTGLALHRSLRSRRPLAVFAAARAAATSGRALPLLAMVAGAALATFALTLNVTAAHGLSDGAWRTVGADARLDVPFDAAGSTADLIARVAAAPGVRHAVAGQTLEGVRVIAADTSVSPQVLVVDTAAFRAMLTDTPIRDTSSLGLLDGTAPPSGGAVSGGPASGGPTVGGPASGGPASGGPASGGPGGGVPVLVRSADGVMAPGVPLALRREGQPALPMIAVGAAPMVGDASDLVIVDAAALTATGMTVSPNTVWATGPGAGDAVRAVASGVEPVIRADVLTGRRDAPLTAGMLRLAWASAATLVVLGLLGLFLGAAAGAPDRWNTLSRLRTLGLRPRDARWVAAGELLPPVLVAAIAGPAVGAVLAYLAMPSLSLRLLTAQDTDPALTAPWWQIAVIAAALLAAVAVVVPIESALRRRRNLGETLRVGG